MKNPLHCVAETIAILLICLSVTDVNAQPAQCFGAQYHPYYEAGFNFMLQNAPGNYASQLVNCKAIANSLTTIPNNLLDSFMVSLTVEGSLVIQTCQQLGTAQCNTIFPTAHFTFLKWDPQSGLFDPIASGLELGAQINFLAMIAPRPPPGPTVAQQFYTITNSHPYMCN